MRPPSLPLIPSTERGWQNVAANLGDLRRPGRPREAEHMTEGIPRAVSRLDRAINARLPVTAPHLS